MVSTLATQWEALRRYRGSPAASASHYFHADCRVVYIPTGKLYAGLSAIEQLLTDLRNTFQCVESVEVLSTSYSEATATVIEETLLTIRHNRPMEWLAPGIKDTGETLKLVVCTISDIHEGRIINQRLYWDQGYVFRTLRCLPQTVMVRGKQITLQTAGPEVVDHVISTLMETDPASQQPQQPPVDVSNLNISSPPASLATVHEVAHHQGFQDEYTKPKPAAQHQQQIPQEPRYGKPPQEEFPTTGGKRASTRLYGKPPGGQSSISFG